MIELNYRLAKRLPMNLINSILDSQIHICLKKRLIYDIDLPEYIKDLVWEVYNGDKPRGQLTTLDTIRRK